MTMVSSKRSAATSAVPAPPRFPLNTLAIGFGLAGLAAVWSESTSALGLPRWVPQMFWAIAAIAWVWLVVAHLGRGIRSGQRLVDQLRHPVQGPLAPVTAMLLAGDLATWSLTAGRVVFLLATVAAALLAGWMLAFWLGGSLAAESVHAGYLLPTVAPGLVGAEVAGHIGLPAVGWALFGVGSFFAAVMTTVVVARLAARPPLPSALLPTTAVLMAPPAVAGLAWFALRGPTADPVAQGVAGLTVLLVVLQIALLPRYRQLAFSLGFWSFTFPVAAVVALSEKWLTMTRPAGWQVASGVLAAAMTLFIAAIAVRSLGLVARRGVPGATAALASANGAAVPRTAVA